MTASPSPATQPVSRHFRSQVLAKLKAHGCLLLENPDGRLHASAEGLRTEVGAVVIASGSSLEVKRAAESTFTALRGRGPFALEQTLLVVVQQRPVLASEDPYLEYAEAGAGWRLNLQELTADALTGRLSIGEVHETFQANPHLTLAQADELGQARAVQTHVFQPVYGVTDADAILKRFAHDPVGDAKLPLPQLAGVAEARLGLALDTGSAATARRSLWTFLLGEALRPVPGENAPSSGHATARARKLLRDLRSERPDAFAAWAEQFQSTLTPVSWQPEAEVWLPAQDDLRQQLVVKAIRANQPSDVLPAIASDDFWAMRGERAAAWTSLRVAQGVLEDVLDLRQNLSGTLSHLTTQYQERWYRIDGSVRQLETLNAVPEEVRPAVEHARQEARQAVHELANATMKRYRTEGIQLALPPQTHIFKDAVLPYLPRSSAQGAAPHSRSVAYLLIDALRFDLGKDLQRLLSAPGLGLQVHLEARSATLPSITPFGMASLMPGAEAGLGVTVAGEPVLAGKVLKDVVARKKLMAEAFPLAQPQDYQLDKLPTEATLRSKLQAGTRLFVVRDSQLDAFGEVDAAPAIATFGLVLDQVARATQRLLAAGIERVVIATDHGFLMLPGDSANKVAAPTPGTVLLKSRFWMGELPTHGLPLDALSVPLPDARLGNPDGQQWSLLFPPGRALFTVPGGNNNYTHGGPTLQERVVPLLTVTRHPEAAPTPDAPKRKKEILPTLHAIFAPSSLSGFRGVSLSRGDLLGGPMKVRVDLIDDPENPKAQHGTLISPQNISSEVTLQDQATELMFSVPHTQHWTLVVQDAEGRILLTVPERPAQPVQVAAAHAWNTPDGAAAPADELLPLLSALVTQRDLGADDIDKLARQHGLTKRQRRAFDEYLDALATTHPHLIVRDSTQTPHRYRMEGQL